MGTPFQVVFDAFLARVNEIKWASPDDLWIAERDWLELMKIAIFRFRYPRVDLEMAKDQLYFVNDIGAQEVQVLAVFMKHEWVKRCVASWENIKMLYSNKDFSQANHLDKLIKLSDQVAEECCEAERIYSRSVNGKPFNYMQFAGKGAVSEWNPLHSTDTKTN